MPHLFVKAVSALAFSPDGCFLYSGGDDAMVSSWNMLAAVDPEGSESFKVGNLQEYYICILSIYIYPEYVFAA